jgi:hypothetical protein
MVHTRSAEKSVLDILGTSTGQGQAPRGLPCGNAPPSPPPRPLVSLEQLLATKNELMRMLMENDTQHGAGRTQHPRQQDMDLSYSDFLVTHLPLFFEPRDPLEADNWLHTTKSKFGLLHCTEI